MKKTIALLLSIMLTISLAACGAPKQDAEIDIGNGTNAEPAALRKTALGADVYRWRNRGMALHDDDIWAITNDTLYRFDLTADSMADAQPLPSPGNLLYQSNFVVDPDTGHVWLIWTDEPENAASRLVMIERDQNGAEVSRVAVDMPHDNLIGLTLRDGKLYALSRSSKAVHEIDRATGQSRRLDIPPVMAVSACAEGLFLCMEASSEAFKFGVYSFETESLSREITVKGEFYGVPELFATDETDGRIYICSADMLYRFDLETEILQYLYTTTSGLHGYVYGLRADGNRLAILYAHGAVMVADNPGGVWESGQTMRMLEPRAGSTFGTTIAGGIYGMMGDLHPNLTVDYVRHGGMDEYYDTLIRKLMAKDTDFDLFVIDPGMYEVIAKSMFEDLSQHAGIAQNVAAMVPGMQNLLSQDGKIIGAPLRINIPYITYSNLPLARYGIQPPTEPVMTLDGYKALFSGVTDSFQWEHPTVAVNPRYLFEQYIAGFLTGEKEVTEAGVAALMGELKDMLDAGMLTEDFSWEGLFAVKESFYMDYKTARALLPLLDADSRTVVGVDLLCVNPYAANKELALEFLELMTSPDTEALVRENTIASGYEGLQFQWSNAGVPPEPLTEEMKYTFMAESYSTFLFENPYLADNEWFALYKDVISNSIRAAESNAIQQSFQASFGVFAEGRVTVEAAAENVYKRMLMVRDE